MCLHKLSPLFFLSSRFHLINKLLLLRRKSNDLSLTVRSYSLYTALAIIQIIHQLRVFQNPFRERSTLLPAASHAPLMHKQIITSTEDVTGRTSEPYCSNNFALELNLFVEIVEKFVVAQSYHDVLDPIRRFRASTTNVLVGLAHPLYFR